MKKVQLLSYLFLLFGVMVYGQNPLNNEKMLDQAMGWKSLVEEKYEIKYPKSWELNSNGMMGTKFILFSPVANEKDQFRENVNLIIQDLTGYNLTLNQYTEISVQQIKATFPGSEMTANEKLKGESFEFQKLIYTGKQGDFDLKFEQYFWIVDQEAFVLTLTCEVSEFDNYQFLGETILNTFKIKR